MNLIYYYDFKPSSFSLDITKELCGKILEAELHIELSGTINTLLLKSPKVPSAPSITIRDIFNDLTTKPIDSFKVFGEQHEPGLRDSDMLWRIELWRNGEIKYPIVHCTAIEGLPKDGWK